MIECEKVRKRLFKIYGKRILCRIGVGETTYNASTENYQNADMAVYIHEKHRVALVWNLENRRRNNRVVKSLSLSKEWKDILPQNGQITAIYKRMGADGKAPYEKVLVLDIDTLFTISEELHLYTKINSDDIECPEEVKKIDSGNYDVIDDGSRNRVSTSRWERDRKFRIAVLTAYGRKCAICRCAEEKLLEAAHIVAVADGGTDNPENGICLCANHHIMFDKELIKIDFDKHILTDAADSVKNMSWYPVFIEKYGGELLLPKYKNTSGIKEGR